MLLRRLTLTLLALGFFSYVSVYLYDLLAPPRITVISPAPDFLTRLPQIKIQGHTNPEAQLLLNRVPLLLSPQGEFATTLTLTQGLSQITFQAKKRYGKTRTITRQVLLLPAETPLSQISPSKI